MTKLRMDELGRLPRLQMAGEADLSRIEPARHSKDSLTIALRDGNGKSSKFTEADSVEFAKDWHLLSHIKS